MRAGARDSLEFYGGQKMSGQSASGDDGRRRDIAQRSQREGPFVHARMGNPKLREVKATATV